jgi:hypothetical protein
MLRTIKHSFIKRILLLGCVFSLLMGCNQFTEKRDFFYEQRYPHFSESESKLPLFGLDSLYLDSLNTIIEGEKYWYLNTAPEGLFNISGYIRFRKGKIYIIPNEKDDKYNSQEQVLFDFSGNVGESWIIEYERSKNKQSIQFFIKMKFYNKLIDDSVVVFKAVHEDKLINSAKEFLVQVSLKKGLVSFIYLSNGIIYTIDYLPRPHVKVEKTTMPVYPTL